MSGRRSERAGRPGGTQWMERTSNRSRCRKVGMNPIVDSTTPRLSETLTSHPSWSRTPLHCGLGPPPATPEDTVVPLSFAVVSFSPDGGGSNSNSFTGLSSNLMPTNAKKNGGLIFLTYLPQGSISVLRAFLFRVTSLTLSFDL